jgi:hypothetical protein
MTALNLAQASELLLNIAHTTRLELSAGLDLVQRRLVTQ